jgi:hypothetical protein
LPFKLASLIVEIGADMNPLQRAIGGLRGQFSGAGAGLLAAGAALGPALGAAAVVGGGALATGLYKAVRAASGLNETLSKVGVVFGDAATDVTGQAEEMAKRFGLNKKELLDSAAGFGLVGKAAGQTQSEAAALANQMAKLAADSASFFNTPLDVALEKIRAGLVGESEPLRAFGVLLSEDAVKAEALAIGVGRATKALDEKAKVAARASLIVKGLRDATGDLERTESSTENQIRRLTGSMGNLAADIGQELLPSFNQMLTLLNSAGSAIGAAFDANKPVIGAFGDLIGSIGELAGDLGGRFIGAFEGIAPSGEKVATVLRTIAGGIRNLPELVDLGTIVITEKLMNIGETFVALGENARNFGLYLAGNWKQLAVDAVNAVGVAFLNLGLNIAKLSEALQSFAANPLGGFNFDWTPLLEGFKATADELPAIVLPKFVDMQDDIKDRMNAILKDMFRAPEQAAPGGGAPAEAAQAAAKRAAAKQTKGPEELSLADAARKLRAKDDTGIRQLAEAVKQTTRLERMIEQLQAVEEKMGRQMNARFG